MGRIDEALRRTNGTNGGPVPVRASNDVFQTAWSFNEVVPETVDEHSARVASVAEETIIRPAGNVDTVAMVEAFPASADRMAPQVESPAAVERRPHSLLVEEPSPAFETLTRAWMDRLAVSPTVNPMLVEQFRRLAATLFHAQSTSQMKVVMVTSASPGDGKTMTAVNLALTLSESYRRRVLLVDSDLRRPSISNISQVAPKVGLSESLKSDVEEKLSLLQLTDMLTLLPAGRPDPDPMSGLTSPRMKQIVEEAAARFDWVIFDAPPVGPVADANLLAAIVDAVLFVVRAGSTRHDEVQKAINVLGRERIFGVVLNAVDASSDDEYGRHYALYQGNGASA